MSDRSAPIRVKYLPLDQLVPYAGNARTHPEHQIAKLCASLAEFGWTSPILHAERQLIAGHGRLEAALQMRASGRAIAHHPDPNVAPTIDLSHLTPEQRRAYVLADNRIAEDSGWDPEKLRAELAALMAQPLDLSVVGFDEDEMAKYLREPDFTPAAADSQGRLDQKARVTCPQCGHNFAPP